MFELGPLTPREEGTVQLPADSSSVQSESRSASFRSPAASGSNRAVGMELVAALVTLTGTVARLHAADGRADQAHAAQAAQHQVRSWQDTRLADSANANAGAAVPAAGPGR